MNQEAPNEKTPPQQQEQQAAVQEKSPQPAPAPSPSQNGVTPPEQKQHSENVPPPATASPIATTVPLEMRQHPPPTSITPPQSQQHSQVLLN